MTHMISHWPVTVEARFRSQASVCVICDAKSGTGPCFSPSTSGFPSQYHSTNAPNWCSFIVVPEGQMGEAWEPSKRQCSFGNQAALGRKVLLTSLSILKLKLEDFNVKLFCHFFFFVFHFLT